MHANAPPGSTSQKCEADPASRVDEQTADTIPPATPEVLDDRTREFYLRAMDVLDRAGVPYMVGGAYSLAYHAGIVRHTKDLDLFVKFEDRDRAMNTLAEAGYRTELTFPHWLGKAFDPADVDTFVDIIYGSGNGLCLVDDEWVANAVDGEAIGRPAKLCPAEEIIWSKAFIQERERFDGADVNHLILARGRTLDWARLLRRFRGHERVLLGHLIFFGFAFPAERSRVPEWVLDDLWAKVKDEPPVTEKVCQGTFMSRQQYLVDLRDRGYRDARAEPRGPMKTEDVTRWTDAIGTIR